MALPLLANSGFEREEPTPTALNKARSSVFFCSMCEQERGLDQSNILAADLEECRSRLADRDHQFKELLHR
jgi:hypothetical protein